MSIEESLIKIVIYNYIINNKNETEYNEVKNKITNYLNKHQELKNNKNLKQYIIHAKRHMNTIVTIMGDQYIDAEKYSKLIKEMNIFTNEDTTKGNIDEFLQNVMDIKNTTYDLYFLKMGKTGLFEKKLNKIKIELDNEIILNL